MKAGYGSFKEVKGMTAREVLQAINYEDFVSTYERAYLKQAENENS